MNNKLVINTTENTTRTRVPKLVSIIIPSYNHAHFIKKALDSVLLQTYPYWEALVVDNQSKDNTDDVVGSFLDKRIKLFKIQNYGVIASSRNHGLKQANGEWIAFLDSDDWWSPRKLEESIKALEGGADIIYHNMWMVKKRKSKPWRKLSICKLTPPIFKDLLIKGNMMPNSSVVVRRTLLDRINGLNESRELVTYEDFDAWLSIAKLTDRFECISKTLGYYWCGGGNMSEGKGGMEYVSNMFLGGMNSKYLSVLNKTQIIQVKALIAYTNLRLAFKSSSRSYLGKKMLNEALLTENKLLKLKINYMRIITFFRNLR
ncbi:glycosyltransferase [bacterium]|nr:glycosyltransferase [bacterium]